MWYSGSKCQKIGALVKANHKQLKADLASGVRKLGPSSIALKLGEFPLFDGFLDLADFLLFEFPDLANFSGFGSTHFDSSFDSLPPLTSPTLLAAKTLTPINLLVANTYDDMAVFSIDVSGVAILLKPLMNQ